MSTPVTPPQATAAGFTTIAFFDDFTSNTINPTSVSTLQAGYNWYPSHSVAQNDPTNYHLETATLASDIANGDNGTGGTNASPNGGIVRIYGTSPDVQQNQSTLQSIPQALIATETYTGPGVYGPLGYLEAYIQYNPSLGTEHIGFWWNPLVASSAATELDIMEQGAAVFGTSNWQLGQLNQWSASGVDFPYTSLNDTVASDAQWHTFGMLVQATSGGQGTVSVFFDNILMGSITVGNGTSYPPALLYPRVLLAGKDWGAGTGNSINYDWVRFWASDGTATPTPTSPTPTPTPSPPSTPVTIPTDSWNKLPSTTTNTVTYTGLTPNTLYSLRIIADNSVGYSDSNVVVQTTGTTPTPVSTPTPTPTPVPTPTPSPGNPISYGTDSSVFPSPLPLSAAGVAGEATSPMGWTVDYFDDFTSSTPVTISGWGSGLQTGATYANAPAVYGQFWNGTGWGGYMGSQGGPAVEDFNNVSISGSNLICQATLVGGVIHLGCCVFAYNTPWGYFEASIKCARSADYVSTSNIGNEDLINNGYWFGGPSWPQAGEYDVFEDGWGITGWATTIHCGPDLNTDRVAGNGNGATLPGGTNWYDGNYHTYGALLTPSYVATYIDGTMVFSTSSSECLANLTTTTNPPTATAPGSFGYLAEQYTSSLSGSNFTMIIGIDFVNGSSWTSSQFPMQMEIDWIRHSVLYPATGGPHV